VQQERDPGGPPQPGVEKTELSLREERLRVGKTARTQHIVRIGKDVETEHVSADIPRAQEDVDVQRVPPAPDDSGEVETLPDGSVSIPILEEELVITKRTVVRERLIVRKVVRTEQARVEADLKRERVDIQADPDAIASDERPAA
jgi:uncharacterized protein (TIGR02271 family)